MRKLLLTISALSLVFLLLTLSACGGGEWPKEGTCEDPNFMGPCKEETLSKKTPPTPPRGQGK